MSKWWWIHRPSNHLRWRIYLWIAICVYLISLKLTFLRNRSWPKWRRYYTSSYCWRWWHYRSLLIIKTWLFCLLCLDFFFNINFLFNWSFLFKLRSFWFNRNFFNFCRFRYKIWLFSNFLTLFNTLAIFLICRNTERCVSYNSFK